MANLTDSALNIVRTQNHCYKFDTTGLMPNTVHTITIDGVDHGYATKQMGKDYGDPLISNENGDLSFCTLVELRFPRDMNFELPRRTTMQFQNEQLGNDTKSAVNTVNNKRVIELASYSGLSKSQIIMDLRTLLTAGPVQTLYPIE